MTQKRHVMHGRDHLEHGADPIPGLGDCCSSGTPGSFVEYLQSIGDLRGYWRLGETDEPFADTSGYAGSGAPYDMSIQPLGTDPTPDVPGGLSAGEDDGAVEFHDTGPSVPELSSLQAGTGLFTGVAASFTAAAWVKPGASTSAWRGGVFSNQTVIGGSPDFERGWSLEVEWPGGTNPLLARFTRTNSAGSVESTAAPGPVPDEWCFLACTYDGATRRLYVNGALVDSDADTRTLFPDATGATQIGEITYMVGAVNRWGPFYGVIDEVAFWGAVLTDAEILTLYELGVTGSTVSPAGDVLTADGSGGSSYQPLPPAVDSIAATGETGLTGDVTLSAGTNVTLTQAGQNIQVAATGGGGGDPVDDTQVWMPLTTVTGGVPELVWDGDDQLIPTLTDL